MPEKSADLLKAVFSANLKRYMEQEKMNTADLASALSLSFSTVSDWVHGRKYPRMDKVQAIADLFGIMKSDLTEDSSVKEKPPAQGGEPVDPITRELLEIVESSSSEERAMMLDMLKVIRKQRRG